MASRPQVDRHHYNEQICGGELGKIEKQTDEYARERGGTGDGMVVISVRED